MTDFTSGFFCPITLELIIDPDGNSNNERSAIEHLVQRYSPSAITDNQQSVLNNIQLLEETIKTYSTNDVYLTDLLTDLSGQVKQAFSRYDWFKKWDAHYLPSIARAHLLQQCNHFKDPGVQHYGKGELFNSIRDEMDSIFCALPAPKPDYSGATIDMSVFNNSDDPCFHGLYTVRLIESCSLVPSPTNIICDDVYSFALDQGHTIWVNAVECVTLGHGFKDDIVRHGYYGSECVIEDLRIMNEQQKCTGLVEIETKWVMRNKRTDLVNGIRQPQNTDIIDDQ